MTSRRRTGPAPGQDSRLAAACRRTVGLAALLVAFHAAGLALAAAASAHATVLESVPANGATLDRAPERVELTFNEAVEARFGAFQVVDARGRRVDDDAIVRPAKQRIAVGLRAGLPDGSYAATYRVVSADGHPIAGGISFIVGAPSAGGAVDVSRVLSGADAPVGIGPALAVARAVRYVGIAAVVGWVAFLSVAWRPVRRVRELSDERVVGEHERSAADQRPAPASVSGVAIALGATADRWARVVALVGVAGVAATFVLQGANVAGTGILPALAPASWVDVARTRTGLWLLIALVLLLAAAVLLPRVGGSLRSGRVTAATTTTVALTGLLAMTPALGGHPAASHPAAPLVVLQTVHVAAIGAWLGGLMLLGSLLRTVGSVPDGSAVLRSPTAGPNAADVDTGWRTRWRVALLYGFGPLAIGAVLLLLVAGIVLSVVQLSEIGDLIDSAYGRAILLKAVLTASAVAVAIVQRRRMIPRVAAALADDASLSDVIQTSDAIPSGGPQPGRADVIDAEPAVRTVRRLIGVEVGLLLAVLVVTGALAGYGQPGRGPAASASSPANPPPSGPLVREITVDGRRLLRLELAPGVAGANDLTVRAVGVDGRPDRDGRDPRLRLTGPDGRPLDPPLRRASRGRWVARGVPLGPAGSWTARLQLRTSAFDEDDVRFEVPLR